MPNTLPHFPFWAKDWLASTSVRRMSLEARGLYMDLLAIQWEEGHIDDNPLGYLWVSGFSIDRFQPLWDEVIAHFPLRPDTEGKRANERLVAIRERAEVQVQANRAHGAKGGRPKGTHSVSDGLANENPKLTQAKGNKSHKDSQNIGEPPKPPKGGFDALSLELPPSVSSEVWSSWVKHRKEIKHPLTEETVRKQLAMLAAKSQANAMIEQSIREGWTGIFELKIESKNGKPTMEDARDRAMKAIEGM